MKKAIKQTSIGKAPGIDGPPAEILKVAGPDTLDTFHNILNSIWEGLIMLNDFQDAIIINLFKNKGNKAEYRKYHGISPLSILGKMLAQVILNCLINSVSEEYLPDYHCGFTPSHNTVDMVLSLTEVQEKCIEQTMDLYAVFINLTQAFNTVIREALWVILTNSGCPQNFIQVILFFHKGMIGLISSSGYTSTHFDISNGVK